MSNKKTSSVTVDRKKLEELKEHNRRLNLPGDQLFIYQVEIAEKIEFIADRLATYGDDAVRINWGHVTVLSHINDKLSELCETLNITLE